MTPGWILHFTLQIQNETEWTAWIEDVIRFQWVIVAQTFAHQCNYTS